MTKLQETYDKLTAELATIEQRATALRLQIQALEMAGATSSGAAVTESAKAHGNGVRAPRGSLTESILRVVAKAALTNRQIRDALKAEGYQHSLEPLHMSKTLQRLVKLKKVKASGPMNNRTYAKIS